jgi:hypothetical protein
MELTDDTTTDDQGGRGSAKAGSSKGKAKVKANDRGTGAFRSSSGPMRSYNVNRKCVIDSDTDDDDDDDREEVGTSVSDEY